MEKLQLPEVREEGRPDVDGEHQAALLIDFDNVTMGIRSNLGQELRNLLNSDVIRGKVAVQRAYADWRRYPQYIVPLSEASIDLIFAPAYGSSKKNATDIRLAIDALELVFVRPEIKTFILMSGDSDFSSLVLKLKEYGKYIIGVGIQESSSDLLVQNCDEYYSYTSLSGLSKAGEGPVERHDPWVLVEKAVAKMVKRGDTMRSDRLKQVMLEIDSSFDEKEQGFSKFNRFVVDAASRGLITIQKMENGQYGVAPAGSSKAERDERKRDEKKRDAGEEDGKQGRRGGRRRRGNGEKTRAKASEKPSGDAGATRRARPRLTMESALELLDQVLGQLLEGAEDTVRDSDVKRRLLEVHPQFDEGEIGFNKFSKFLQAAEESGAVELSRGPNGNYYVARPSRSRKRARPEKRKKTEAGKGREEAKGKRKGKEEGKGKAQQRKEKPAETAESRDRESTMRKLARFLFGESPEAPPEERGVDAVRPPLEQRATGERPGTEARERQRGRGEARRERGRSTEAGRGRREQGRQRERGEVGRDRRGRARSEGRADGGAEEAGGRERAAPRGDRREPRAEPEERKPREARGDRRARGRRASERGRESRPESETERERDRGRAAEPSATRTTEPEAQPSRPAVEERPATDSPAPATKAREEGVAPPPDGAEPADRGAPASGPGAADEEGESGVVVPAPMPGAPRGTIRGRWGSRGRYRPPTEAPPILEGQSAPGGEQAEPAGLTATGRPDDSVESSGDVDAPGPEPPAGAAWESAPVSVNRALVDRLTAYAGIGARTAERLVEAFGEDVIRVIDDQPDRVRELLPDHRAELVIQAREEERRLQSPRGGED